jgi:mycothiol synthase
VAPSYRRRGYGTRLVEAALADSADGRLRLWSHGRSLAAAALAYRFGFRSERVLWQMRRSLYAPIPAPQLPAGVAVRTFVVDQDEAAWTEVNNRAFADHPDQGHWSVTEVQKREQEPWFDPSGFFLAERGDRLVGFHWTKIHGGDHDAWRLGDGSHGHEPIGEVYVVGVDPAEQGNGLGPALTLIGLRYLRSRGLSAAMLYVDETNRRAIKLYESVGFTRWDIDVGYQRG